MNFSIEQVEKDPVVKRETELVERKGIGHPDSICDGIAEAVSRKLCRKYRERFGKILHHNTDEAQLVAGQSNPELGGGETVEPIYILLTGRATKQHDQEKIPVERFAVEAARDHIRKNFKELSPEDIEFETRIGETSTDLKRVFRSGKAPPANDTSFGVGHAPLSELEKTVKQIEKQASSEIDPVGEDVKVMGLKRNGKIHLTIAAAIISKKIDTKEDYIDALDRVKELAEKTAKKNTELPLKIHINTADVIEEDSIYITETGTSAEMGDDGSVGRGNRVNGLITPERPMSLEAASGKNPVTHVGKIYNLLANQAAETVHKETGEFVQLKLLSQIGQPIDEPQIVDIQTTGEEEKIQEIVQREIEDIESITDKVVEGRLDTF